MYYDVIETGRRIQKLRKGKGLTQEQLAKWNRNILSFIAAKFTMPI
ncbi:MULTISPECIES: hypothetical protein [unclassified Neglectibacter]|nr:MULTISPECIES: hypothetical protein [unclassified Neglectibacter]